MRLTIVFIFLLQIGYSQVETIEETASYNSNLKILEANLTAISNNKLNNILTDVIKAEQNCYNNHWVVNLGFQENREYIYIATSDNIENIVAKCFDIVSGNKIKNISLSMINNQPVFIVYDNSYSDHFRLFHYKVDLSNYLDKIISNFFSTPMCIITKLDGEYCVVKDTFSKCD